jgi:hypothetical protein
MITRRAVSFTPVLLCQLRCFPRKNSAIRTINQVLVLDQLGVNRAVLIKSRAAELCPRLKTTTMISTATGAIVPMTWGGVGAPRRERDETNGNPKIPLVDRR